VDRDPSHERGFREPEGILFEPQGMQLMTLFRLNKLVPFKDEYLESVESLLREHRDLTGRVAQRK